MNKYFLVKGNVVEVIRRDHFGDPQHWLVKSMDEEASRRGSFYWVLAKACIPLDPALNILFERKDDEQ